MKKSFVLLSGIALLLLSSLAMLSARPDGSKPAPGKNKAAASPHEEHWWDFGAQKITIVYGRPYKKGRVIFGGLEPWGKVWRTGADEATTLTTTADLMIGPLHVVAGTYGLFTIPNEKEWTLILNKTSKQWGAFKYDAGQDYGRAPMKVSVAKAPVEQLTIDIEKKNASEGVLKIMWDTTVASTDIVIH
jgi:hypothetical protein